MVAREGRRALTVAGAHAPEQQRAVAQPAEESPPERARERRNARPSVAEVGAVRAERPEERPQRRGLPRLEGRSAPRGRPRAPPPQHPAGAPRRQAHVQQHGRHRAARAARAARGRVGPAEELEEAADPRRAILSAVCTRLPKVRAARRPRARSAPAGAASRLPLAWSVHRGAKQFQKFQNGGG